MQPAVRDDSLRGDIINIFLLRPVYREPKKSVAQELEEYRERKYRYAPERPEPRPKVEPIHVYTPHNCPKEDWERDADGNPVPMETIVRCPDCRQVWIMEANHMTELSFTEQYLKLPVFLLADRILNRKKK